MSGDRKPRSNRARTDRAPPDRTRSGGASSDHELEDLLALLEQPDILLREAEQMLARLQPSPTVTREQIVERLLSALEAARKPVAEPPVRAEFVSDPPAGAGTRIASQDTALILLSFLGDETVVPRLLALLDRESLPDDFKLKLISVIHEFNPKLSPDDLLGQLRNPHKAIQQSHREHLRRLQSPLELGFWLDVMANEMPLEARVSFVRASAEVNEPLAVPLLICLCYDEDPDVALAAMDAVERYKDARALPALEELAERYPHDGVQREARKAADRLRIRASLSPQVTPVPPPEIYLCYLTTIDGTGCQAALLVRHGAPGMLRIGQVLFNDELGIEDCFGLDILAKDLDDLLDELVDRGLSPVDVPYAQFIQAIEFACERTWSEEWLLPPCFVAWREWFTWEWTHGGQAEQRMQARTEPTYVELFMGALPTHERARLLHDSPDLLFQDEFECWLFDEDELGDLADAFWELVEKGHGQPPKVSAVRPLLRQVVQRAVTDDLRGLIRERLWRVAPLLHDLYVEDEVWQWAVVAAAALDDDGPLPPEEHPFLLAMAAHSLESVVGTKVVFDDRGMEEMSD